MGEREGGSAAIKLNLQRYKGTRWNEEDENNCDEKGESVRNKRKVEQFRENTKPSLPPTSHPRYQIRRLNVYKIFEVSGNESFVTLRVTRSVYIFRRFVRRC